MSSLQPSLSPSCPSPLKSCQPTFIEHLLLGPMQVAENKANQQIDMVPALLSSLHFPSIAHVIEAALKTFYNASQTHLLNHYFLYRPTRLRMVVTTTWTWTSLFLSLCLPLGILLSSFLPVQKTSSSEVPLKCPHILCNSILNHFQTRETSSSSAYVISVSSPHTATYCPHLSKCH